MKLSISSISGEIAQDWYNVPLNFTDGKSTLVRIMAWCHQATSHYLSQCWLRSMSPYGITRPQWVNIYTYLPIPLLTNILYPAPIALGKHLCLLNKYLLTLLKTTSSCSLLNAIFGNCIPKDEPQKWLTHWGRDKMAAILQTIFKFIFLCENWCILIIISLEFLFSRVQITIIQHWFR